MLGLAKLLRREQGKLCFSIAWAKPKLSEAKLTLRWELRSAKLALAEACRPLQGLSKALLCLALAARKTCEPKPCFARL